MTHHLRTVLGAMLCASLVLAGCVSKSTYLAKEQEAEALMEARKRAEARNRELTRRVQDLEQEERILSAKRDELEAQAASLEDRVNELTRQHQAAAARAAALDGQVRDLSQKHQAAAARAAALDGQVRDLSQKHQAAAARAGALDSQVRDLSQKYQAAAAGRDQGQARAASLKRQLEDLTRQHQAAAAWAASLDGEVTDLNQKHQAALQEAERLRRETEEKAREIANLRATYHELVSDLQREIKAGEIKVTQYKNLLTVNLVEKILFDSGRAEIRPRGRAILTRVGEILKNVKDKEIRVEGHTDNVPISSRLAVKYPTNWELSTARATMVARYFRDKVKIPAERLAAAGFAEYRPVAPNTTSEGRAQNRRIEIILAPLPSASVTE
ncbi:MAG: OmpA family protein [Candidatus Methylomirabilia bacterium]